MTTGQPEKYVAAIFNFGQRTTILPNTPATYLPLVGGTNQSNEISLIIPHDGILKNLFWDCESNGLTGIGNNLKIKMGAMHFTPTSSLPLHEVMTTVIDRKTNEKFPSWNFKVYAGQRVAVMVQTVVGGTSLSGLRVSFELEVEKWSQTWQLAEDGTTIFYDGGNVGIGTSTPETKLDVLGSMHVNGAVGFHGSLEINGSLKITDGTEGDGKYFTSDKNGNGKWTPLPEVLTWINSDFGTNIFVGAGSGESNKADDGRGGIFNTFIGSESGASNSTGYHNTALGSQSFHRNKVGHENTSSGFHSLFFNTEGSYNAAHGNAALYSNTIGNCNTANGTQTLNNNTIGNGNTATGMNALYANTSGNANTASGAQALLGNTTGESNSAYGYRSLLNNSTGKNNTAIGVESDVASGNLSNATAIGYKAVVSKSNSLVLGGTGSDAVNVGIGTTAPETKLDVIGSIKITDGTEAAGKVLTCDAKGKASWTSPIFSAGALPEAIRGQMLRHDGKTWVSDSLIFNNGINVGIGTSSPKAKLDVAGAISGFGIVPIGTITAWHKSLPGMPALPDGWVECNGQKLDDIASPFNNQLIPDLNQSGRFLRGSATSGILQADALQKHKHIEPGHTHIVSVNGHGQPGGYGNYGTPYNGNADIVTSPNQVQLGDPVDSDTGAGTPRTANETRPINMSVVWIMRVK